MKNSTKTRGRGRPQEFNWKGLSNYWRGSSNVEIALATGSTPARVSQVRARLIAEARKQGKDEARFQSNYRWGRVREDQVAKIKAGAKVKLG